VAEAETVALRKGFNRYNTEETAKEFIGNPEPPIWGGEASERGNLLVGHILEVVDGADADRAFIV